jgi:hypothetical protein
MSLISSASPWMNDETIPKKRIPSLRKTAKKAPIESTSNNTEYVSDEKLYLESQVPESIQSTQANLEERNSRVSQLLNQITNDNDGNKLANFTPLDNPEMQKRTDKESDAVDFADNDILGPVQPNPARIYQQARQPSGPGNYVSNLPDLGGFYSNYRTSYETPRIPIQQPMLQQLAGNSPLSSLDNKIMEKINYMIHMLEQQHNERTNNITEEFLLYMFLGVFIIFIVDSFARAGKYIR